MKTILIALILSALVGCYSSSNYAVVRGGGWGGGWGGYGGGWGHTTNVAVVNHGFNGGYYHPGRW
jgi:hypothetical protein